MESHDVEQFMSLFRGNQRSVGVWIEEPGSGGRRGKNLTESRSYLHDDFVAHLGGTGRGIGVVPILDDSTCWWGCIDIDNHGSKADIDFELLLEQIDQLRLPLVVCRSKGGGAHCYLFGVEPLRAATVMKLLNKWARDLNVYAMATNGQVDIFPKQDRLAIGADGERAKGNYVNLPYYRAEDSLRYGMAKGIGRVSLKAFIAYANLQKVTQNQVNAFLNAGHAEAPPCIQKLLLGEAECTGGRNDTMYNMTIYFKKARPDTYRDDLYDLNHRLFDVPLDATELKKVVSSASRRDYKYKCGEEPLKSLCDSRTCLKRRFGISQQDLDEMRAADDLPVFENLVKYLGDPVKYTLEVNGVLLKDVRTETLLRYADMRREVYEGTSILLPLLPQKRWESMLIELTAKQRVVDTPDEASPAGIIRSRLEEFIGRADLSDDGVLPNYTDLFNGLPIVKQVTKAAGSSPAERVVLFRAMDFVEYLRKTRSEELKANNLWLALKRTCGATHVRVRTPQGVKNLWCVPVPDSDSSTLPDFEPEF